MRISKFCAAAAIVLSLSASAILPATGAFAKSAHGGGGSSVESSSSVEDVYGSQVNSQSDACKEVWAFEACNKWAENENENENGG